MFPQTELDNYKLQVELLQEKLQRSEITRQHLEHKLEKVLQKREEHQKSIRSKTRQKYQEFLEEQHRRNERNKQLVQMLERIEEQTTIMNARSERLKMMKLQYEMYFAKLVHSQTRRCIQNSTTPMMASSMANPMPPTLRMSSTNLNDMEYNGIYNVTPLVDETGYQRYAADPLIDRTENVPSLPRESHMSAKLMEISGPGYTTASERNDFQNMSRYQPNTNHPQMLDTDLNIRDFAGNPLHTTKQPLVDPREHILRSTGIEKYPSNEPKFYTSTGDVVNNNMQLPDLDMSTSRSSSSIMQTFNAMPDSHKAESMDVNSYRESSSGSSVVFPQAKQDMVEQAVVHNPYASETPSEVSGSLNNDHVNLAQRREPIAVSDIQRSPMEAITELRNKKIDEVQPKQSPKIDTKPLQEPLPIREHPKPEVSLENIENAIYGELVNSSDETQQIQDKTGPTTSLLENLVTHSPEIVETAATNNVIEESPVSLPSAEVNDAKYNDATSLENIGDMNLAKTYETEYNYDNATSAPGTEEITNDPATNTVNSTIDYTGYESTAAADDGQQPQEYDYSNYDPSQYSYPGYIYDEATGEYKPDPNATAEQFATDQQYAQEYDGQYQQQDYDYTQAYEQNPQGEVAPEYANYEQTDATVDQTPVSAETAEDQMQNSTQKEITPAQETNAVDNTMPDNSEAGKSIKPILSTADKNDQQKKQKKRVNFVESSETDESSSDNKAVVQAATAKGNTGNESDFDFSSGSEAAVAKA